jgi:hypothetical protein
MSRHQLAQVNVGIIKGPTVDAFTFRKAFPPPDATRPEPTIDFGDECPAT